MARDAVGLHAARLSSPYVAAWVRSPGLQTVDIREKIFNEARMIKLRCMRSTLHVLPLDVAPIAHKATLRRRLSAPHSRLRTLSVEPAEIQKTREWLLGELEDGLASSRELEKRFVPTANRGDERSRIEMLRTVLKILWEEGIIAYRNYSHNWSREKRQYGLTSALYPSLRLEGPSATDALRELVRRHISAYGPVSIPDIQWWLGMGREAVISSLKAQGRDVIEVNVKELPGPLFMLEDCFEKMDSGDSAAEWIAFLSHEDPLLKAYHETRVRYISPESYQQLFNAIGEARSSIMIDGEVVGIWEWNHKEQSVAFQFFEGFNSIGSRISSVKAEASRLEQFLAEDFSDNQMGLFG